MSATCPSRTAAVVPQSSVTSTHYWHGGAPGLRVGDYILPPSVTGTSFTLTAYVGEEASRAGYQPTRVYLTEDLDVAKVFAAMCLGGGWVYRVEPEGQLEADPDVEGKGTSWACERARIVEVMPLDVATLVDILEAITSYGTVGGAA